MEDEIEERVVVGQRFGHIRTQGVYGIAFSGRYSFFALDLLFRIVQHPAFRALGGKFGHLLSPAGGEAQDALATQLAQPALRYRLRRGEHYLPFPCHGFQVVLGGDGYAPFPSFIDPAVDGAGVDIRIVHLFSPNKIHFQQH